MDGLLALGILVLVSLPVITVVSFFMLIGARRRLADVERRLIALELGGLAPAEPRSAPPAPAAAIVPPPETDVADAPESLPPPMKPAIAPASVAGPRETLEQKLGARWAVWVGGLALALGAVFLVRYSIDAGLIGPEIRVAGAAAFALALLAGGEWLRRSPRVTSFSAIPAANIPGILTAAGTVGLFATAYGAYALYGLIGPVAAFVLLAAIGLGTMAAAALHGPWLSGLGLVGAYAAPLLVAGAEPHVPILAVYLIFVTAAAFGLARIRLWRWLAIAAAVAAIAWGLVMLGADGDALTDAAYALALLILVLVVFVVDMHHAEPAGVPADLFATLVLAGNGTLIVAGAAANGFAATSILAAMIGGGLMIAAAWRFEPVALAAPIAAALAIALLYLWPAASTASTEATTYVVDHVTAYFPLPATILFFINVAAIAAAALILAGLARLPARGTFATAALLLAATAGPLLILAVAYLRISGFTTSPILAAIALALAAFYGVLAARASAEERQVPAEMIATGIFAAGAVGGIAFGLTMLLAGGALTTALALASLGAAWVETRRPIGALRAAVLVMAIVVFARMAWDPSIFDIRSGPAVYGSILVGYGIPALAFAMSARLLGRRRGDYAARAAEAVAITLFAVLVVFEIHAITFGGDLLARSTRLSEQGLMTAAAFAFALGLSRLAGRRGSPVLRIAALVARCLGLAVAVVSLGFALNPLVTGDPVAGGALFNEIVLAYWLPAILAGLLILPRVPDDAGRWAGWARLATGLVALALIFGGISLEIRFLFAESRDLTAGSIGSAESYSYSAAWLALGLLLLFAGLLIDVKSARLASAAVILATVLKVFLLDMSSLEGVWRALSFMGLGLVLIGIGLLYQRLLFGGKSGPATGGAGG